MNATTPGVKLPARTIHEMAAALGREQVNGVRAHLARLQPAAQREWLRGRWAEKLGGIEPNRQPRATVAWTRPVPNGDVEGITLDIEPGIVVPLLLMKPKGVTRGPVVVVTAQQGKDGVLYARRGEIAELMRRGTLVCLPDVRGTGETAPDARRGPNSPQISLATSALMLGETLLAEGSRICAR